MVAIFLSDGFNEVEVTKLTEDLRKDSIEIKTVSLGKKIVTGACGISIICDLEVEEISLDSVHVAVFSGGEGAMQSSALAPTFASLISNLTSKGKDLAAIFTVSFALKSIESIKSICHKADHEKTYDAEIEIEKKEPVETFSADSQVKVSISDSEFISTEPDYSGYVLPSPELLLKTGETFDDSVQTEIQENADRLIETLDSFGISASIKGVDRGPRLTRYQMVPARGVKVSSIINLKDDLALSLARGPIRIEAPIPGMAAIGIEVLNKAAITVRLRDLIEDDKFKAQNFSSVCIGRDVCGNGVFCDVAKMPHIIVAGATGMGKTNALHNMIVSLLYKARPDELKLILIDTKGCVFTPYESLPHLKMPLVTDSKNAVGALKWAVEEMDRRIKLLEGANARSIEVYNEMIANEQALGNPLHKIVIFIDEFADLMLPDIDICAERLVIQLAQKARAAGIHLIIGTQRPSVNVLTDAIRANVPSRLSCKLMSSVDSKTVLEASGAEDLFDRGDMLFYPAELTKPYRVQGALVSEDEISAVVSYIKSQVGCAVYDPRIIDKIKSYAVIDRSAFEKEIEEEEDKARIEKRVLEFSRQLKKEQESEKDAFGCLSDQTFLDCVEYVIACKYARTGMLQRKFSLGYGKAARYIDLMEDFGIISEANGARPRDVFLTLEEWQEKLKRLPPKDD